MGEYGDIWEEGMGGNTPCTFELRCTGSVRLYSAGGVTLQGLHLASLELDHALGWNCLCIPNSRSLSICV